MRDSALATVWKVLVAVFVAIVLLHVAGHCLRLDALESRAPCACEAGR